jgi:hypothetical protein
MNNVVLDVLGDYLIVSEISIKRREKPTFYEECHVSLAE